ncbi:Uncharacterised protein [uncultured Clostridium sp.]|uniref:hypothetical protein n=1 Tax=uncultured Clostridium sp. TaxID=59620 RepID=UPI0008221928|nr:hypothetical protein [uncultured Clostridium sp.]SCJ45821.1 Uncharacterised protein [uncultured Clostridium sp.]
MDNKEKALIGSICFLVGVAVGFLLKPIKNKVCIESFSCNAFEGLKDESNLEESEAKDSEASEGVETIE